MSGEISEGGEVRVSGMDSAEVLTMVWRHEVWCAWKSALRMRNLMSGSDCTQAMTYHSNLAMAVLPLTPNWQVSSGHEMFWMRHETPYT